MDGLDALHRRRFCLRRHPGAARASRIFSMSEEREKGLDSIGCCGRFWPCDSAAYSEYPDISRILVPGSQRRKTRCEFTAAHLRHHDITQNQIDLVGCRRNISRASTPLRARSTEYPVIVRNSHARSRTSYFVFNNEDRLVPGVMSAGLYSSPGQRDIGRSRQINLKRRAFTQSAFRPRQIHRSASPRHRPLPIRGPCLCRLPSS